MAGILSRSTPSPVTGVVATAWNAGIWGACAGAEGREGEGAEGREGAGAETRVGGAARAGFRVRTGDGRGTVTVTSGSVSVIWPQVTTGNINAPIATACNSL